MKIIFINVFSFIRAPSYAIYKNNCNLYKFIILYLFCLSSIEDYSPNYPKDRKSMDTLPN